MLLDIISFKYKTKEDGGMEDCNIEEYERM